MADIITSEEKAAWHLEGLLKEKGRLIEKLKAIDDLERTLRGTAMLGGGRKAKAPKAQAEGGGKRKVVSAEQRAKQSEAQKKRWAIRKQEAAAALATQAPATE